MGPLPINAGGSSLSGSAEAALSRSGAGGLCNMWALTCWASTSGQRRPPLLMSWWVVPNAGASHKPASVVHAQPVGGFKQGWQEASLSSPGAVPTWAEADQRRTHTLRPQPILLLTTSHPAHHPCEDGMSPGRSARPDTHRWALHPAGSQRTPAEANLWGRVPPGWGQTPAGHPWSSQPRGIPWRADRGPPHRTVSTFSSPLPPGLSHPHLALAAWAFLMLLAILQSPECSEL